jgi:hypothetical protein
MNRTSTIATMKPRMNLPKGLSPLDGYLMVADARMQAASRGRRPE